MKALLHLMKSLDHPTLWYCTRKPTSIPYKIQDSSPLDLYDVGSIYRWLQGGESASGILISVLSLIVLDSTWRLMISYSSLGEFREASVRGEVSGRFHDHPPCKLSLPFVYSCPSHPIEWIFSMHHTFCMWQVRCITPFALSSLYGPVLTSSEQFSVENFWEMM